MTLHVYEELEQGSDEWLDARAGVLTASVVGRLVTPTGKVAKNDTARGLITTLAAERITGNVDQVHVSPDMWRGVEEEPFARDKYREHHSPVTEVGFMIREDNGVKLGYSPDGLVGDDGLIEIKSRLQKKHVQTVLADAVPPENMAQLQAGLLVSGRDWIDYVSYSAGMALWVKRVHPDPAWFSVIAEAAAEFEDAASQIVASYTAATAGLPLTDPRVEPDDITF